ncbi:MAG: AP2 domain-containing protein, partial [Phycisphaerales bacterium]
GFKGVRREKCGLYAAHIQVAGRRYYTYHLTTAEEAARAYDEMARRLHGEFARLNFPEAA